MANMVMFIILAVVILGSALVCITTKRIMRAATFLLFVLLGVAGLYFLLDYTFLGAAQISVYAGGITMIYIFAIQLVSKRTLQGMVERLKGSRVAFGALMTLVGLVTVVAVFFKNKFIDMYHVDENKVEINRLGVYDSVNVYRNLIIDKVDASPSKNILFFSFSC